MFMCNIDKWGSKTFNPLFHLKWNLVFSRMFCILSCNHLLAVWPFCMTFKIKELFSFSENHIFYTHHNTQVVLINGSTPLTLLCRGLCTTMQLTHVLYYTSIWRWLSLFPLWEKIKKKKNTQNEITICFRTKNEL